MVEPCAAAFSRSLDIRGGRPGILTLTYPNKPINEELEILIRSLPTKLRLRRGVRRPLMFCRGMSQAIRRLLQPNLAWMMWPLQGRIIRAALYPYLLPICGMRGSRDEKRTSLT